jgi:hypothetical protein
MRGKPRIIAAHLHPPGRRASYMEAHGRFKMTPLRHHAFVAAILFAARTLKKGETK